MKIQIANKSVEKLVKPIRRCGNMNNMITRKKMIKKIMAAQK